jgi:tetratricopeptide (TPR) repeat protein
MRHFIGLRAVEGITFLFWGLVLIIGIPVSIYVTLKIIKFVRRLREKGLIEEMKADAEKKEREGQFVSAGVVHEKLKNHEKAAALYDRGGDFIKAASLYEALGQMQKAAEMHEKAGDLHKAGETLMSAGLYVEAARIFSRNGDKLMTARALEMTGNRMAAVRAYREAKDFHKAALLLKEEGMLMEAAEMYGFSLAGEGLTASNMDKYYTYAELLESSGDTGNARGIYENILALDPDYLDVRHKLQSLVSTVSQEAGEEADGTVQPTEEFEEGAAAVTETATLAEMMKTRLEPRHGFRLWVQILKVLGEKTARGEFLENVSPENVLADASNRVTFSDPGMKNVSYISPEEKEGATPDQTSLIYSMGVILYEMLAGSLDTLGIKKPSEVMNDVPEWLDDLTMKCICEDRNGRYRTIEEIFYTLKNLKNK